MERHGEFSEALDQDAKDLQAILNLTTRDAQVRMHDCMRGRLMRDMLILNRIRGLEGNPCIIVFLIMIHSS